MITFKGWAQDLMLSLFKREATYNAGVTMSSTNACLMRGYEVSVDWDDEVVTDKGEITGSEFGTDQELNTQRVKITYKEPRAKPNTLAGLGALVLGSITTTQDGALTAYRHRITPVAAGSELRSIQAEHRAGGVQYAYRGIKGNTLKIAGEAGGYASVEAELIGSGTRTSSATSFVSAISESWLRLAICRVWLETGTAISISPTLTQEAQNISTGTPVDLRVRLKSFEWTYNNNIDAQLGFGGTGVAQDLDYGRRSVDLKFSLLFAGATELTYFLEQRPVAIEFDLAGATIATGGTLRFGFQLIVPRFKIKKAPLPVGGVGDILSCDFECDVQSDGTNPVSILEAYNARSGYILA